MTFTAAQQHSDLQGPESLPTKMLFPNAPSRRFHPRNNLVRQKFSSPLLKKQDLRRGGGEEMEKLEEAWQRAAAKQAVGPRTRARDGFRSRLSPDSSPVSC